MKTYHATHVTKAVAKKRGHLWGNGLPGRLTESQVGQSLVEMAIIVPILLLMFLGVFEVGWALRGYLVLVNANREAARFGVKNGVLDFSVKDPNEVGYNQVLSHTTVSISEQLPLEFLGPEPNATMIMSHFVIDTGFPCVQYAGGKPVVPYQFDGSCDCTTGDPSDPDGDGTPWFGRDDLVLHPDMPGYAFHAHTYGLNQPTRISGGNYQLAATRLVTENNQLNCTVFKTGSAGEISANNLFIVETLYDQPQLLGAPLISNPLTDPIPFYTHTAMRITVGRDIETASETVGPVCELYPITFAKQLFEDLGQNGDTPDENTPIHLLQNGSGNDDFNWVAWNPARSGENFYLMEALENPRLAIHDFTDAGDAGDHVLNIGDRLATHTNFSGAGVDNGLADLKDRTIRVPVYDSGSGNVDHIAVVNVTDVLTGSREIFATFRNYDDQACEQ